MEEYSILGLLRGILGVCTRVYMGRCLVMDPFLEIPM